MFGVVVMRNRKEGEERCAFIPSEFPSFRNKAFPILATTFESDVNSENRLPTADCRALPRKGEHGPFHLVPWQRAECHLLPLLN